MRRIKVEPGRPNPIFTESATWGRLDADWVFHAFGEHGGALCNTVRGKEFYLVELQEAHEREFCGMCASLARERLPVARALEELRGDSHRLSQVMMACGPNLANRMMEALQSSIERLGKGG